MASTKAVQRGNIPLGMLALLFTVLKLASITLVSGFVTHPAFPGPSAPGNQIPDYFRTYPTLVHLCAFLQYGSAIALGIFVASVVNRIRSLGVRSTGIEIALFGGFTAALDSICSASALWAVSQPGIAHDATLTSALYFLQFAFGGPGYAVLLGTFMAGVIIASRASKLLPKWVAWFGIILSIVAALSWFSQISGAFVVLIPLTRFPGFVWLVAAGFAMPRLTQNKTLDSSIGL